MSRRRSSPASTRGGAPAAAAPLLRVAFLHPDLGLGGAERLVVDAAAGLCRLGHGVEVFTSHYEPARSFAETRSGAFPVHVHGDWLPRAVLGRLHILCALLRMLWLALRVALRGRFDVLVVDQVSACVPLLKLLCPSARVLFYCHYPDQLLAPRHSLLRAAYRAPFDFLEQVTTGLADGVQISDGARLPTVGPGQLCARGRAAALVRMRALTPSFPPFPPSIACAKGGAYMRARALCNRLCPRPTHTTRA